MLATILGVGGKQRSQSLLMYFRSSLSCAMLSNRVESWYWAVEVALRLKRLLSADLPTPYFLAASEIDRLFEDFNSETAASIE